MLLITTVIYNYHYLYLDISGTEFAASEKCWKNHGLQVKRATCLDFREFSSCIRLKFSELLGLCGARGKSGRLLSRCDWCLVWTIKAETAAERKSGRLQKQRISIWQSTSSPKSLWSSPPPARDNFRWPLTAAAAAAAATAVVVVLLLVVVVRLRAKDVVSAAIACLFSQQLHR